MSFRVPSSLAAASGVMTMLSSSKPGLLRGPQMPFRVSGVQSQMSATCTKKELFFSKSSRDNVPASDLSMLTMARSRFVGLRQPKPPLRTYRPPIQSLQVP